MMSGGSLSSGDGSGSGSGGWVGRDVLCQQVKTIDYVSRGADFIEKISQSLLSDVLAKVRAIVE